jgi:RecB family exonuclease
MKLSNSRVRVFDQCPARYRWTHVDLNRKQLAHLDEWTGFRFGTYVHGVLEDVYRHVKNTKHDGPLFCLAVSTVVTASLETRRVEQDVSEDRKERAAEMVWSYLAREDSANHRSILNIEDFMFLRTTDGHMVNMFADRIDRAHDERRGGPGIVIVDYKASKGPSVDTSYAANSEQGKLYTAAAARQHRWAKWAEFRLEHLGDDSTHSVVRDRHEIRAVTSELVAQFDVDALRLQHGPWPTRPGDWCRTCPFTEWCPEKVEDPDIPDWLSDPSTGRLPLYSPAKDGSNMPALLAAAGHTKEVFP